MKSDGFSLDDKRNDIGDGDIPDILERWEHLSEEEARNKIEQSFMVSKEEIVQNGYDLSLNKYKEIVYEKVEYDPPMEIMARIDEIDMEIASLKEELRNLLEEG